MSENTEKEVVLRIPAVLLGMGAIAYCVLEIWREESPTGQRCTQCRIAKDPAELPDGSYRVVFGHSSVQTRKSQGNWEQVLLYLRGGRVRQPETLRHRSPAGGHLSRIKKGCRTEELALMMQSSRGRRSGYGRRQRLIKRLAAIDEQLRSEGLSSPDRTVLESQRHLLSGTLKQFSERPSRDDEGES